MYESFSIIFALAALLSFVNYKWIKLPTTIGLLVGALGIALILVLLRFVLPPAFQFFCDMMQNADFTHILLDVLLGFLLFAGALHVDIGELKKERSAVALFATIGVLISTFLVGTIVYYLALVIGCEIPFLHALLFGALISPTDPIAVLALLKNTSVSKSLQLKIEGESLFNDGIGVIVFTGVLLFVGVEEMPTQEGNLSFEILKLFGEEVILGIGLGFALGFIGFRLMRSCQDETHLSTIITLAVVFGGYSLANLLHTSGPLAMVVAGLYIGNKIKLPSFNTKTKDNLVGFWHILDESLNGVLFVFLGLAIHLITIESSSVLILAFSSIFVVLIARFISVWLPYSILKHNEHSWLKTTYVLTWGGLRGGISLALAFSLAPEMSKETILIMTYCIVIFSILVQGLTISKLVKNLE